MSQATPDTTVKDSASSVDLNQTMPLWAHYHKSKSPRTRLEDEKKDYKVKMKVSLIMSVSAHSHHASSHTPRSHTEARRRSDFCGDRPSRGCCARICFCVGSSRASSQKKSTLTKHTDCFFPLSRNESTRLAALPFLRVVGSHVRLTDIPNSTTAVQTLTSNQQHHQFLIPSAPLPCLFCSRA